MTSVNAFKRSVAVAALLLATGCGYNTIQTYDEQVNAAASQIKVQLQRRADLIPNLVETVRGYAKQEQTVFTAVAEARRKHTKRSSPSRARKHAGGAAPRAPAQTSSSGPPSVHDRVGHDVLDRVHRLAVHPDLVVQMRARGQSGRADERDLLPALHALTADRENLGAVGVPGHEPIAMIHRDHVAVPLFPLHLGYHAGGGPPDLRAHPAPHVPPLH